MEHISDQNLTPLGQIALHGTLKMEQPLPFVQSFVVAGGRRTYQKETRTEEYYPPQYRTADTLLFESL